jgi:hypothetical protein
MRDDRYGKAAVIEARSLFALKAEHTQVDYVLLHDSQDLRCPRCGDGHDVYLYVSKKE